MSAPQFKDVATALALLTRFPVKAEFDRTAEASWAYPLAGTVLGTCAALMTAIAMWLGVDPMLAAGRPSGLAAEAWSRDGTVDKAASTPR